jgi:hypothetical protein
MATFIVIYHSGLVITNEIGSYEFVGMKKETFLLNEFLTLENVVVMVRERLGWMYEGCEVHFEGQIDIGSSNGPQMKTMSPVCNKEWTAYVRVVMKLEIRRIELVVRMVARNDVGDESSRLMRNTSNVVLCLHNRRKKLRTTLMQMSPHSLPIMKQC